MSTYPIFKNKANKTLVFYACAKNANTSVKLFFTKHLGIENNFFFIEDNIPKHRTKESQAYIKKNTGKTNLINIWPNHQEFKEVNSDIKCCVIRHPFDRFISAYKNRILFHKDNNFKDLTVDAILNKLEENNFENKHFLPQNYYLGNELAYYNFYVDITKINLFADFVNNFFGKKIEFPKLQTGGNNFDIQLTNLQKKRIENIYHKDFKFF